MTRDRFGASLRRSYAEELSVRIPPTSLTRLPLTVAQKEEEGSINKQRRVKHRTAQSAIKTSLLFINVPY